MKKIIVLLLIAVMVGSMAACFNSTEEQVPKKEKTPMSSEKEKDSQETKDNSATELTGEPIVLTVWCWDADFNGKAMEIAEKIYQESHPNVTVKVEVMGGEDVGKRLNTMLVANTKEGLPNIILSQDWDAQKYLNAYPDVFADFTGRFKTDDFAQYKVATVEKEGRIYGMPFDIGVTGLYYRRDYLEQAGFKPEDLQNITWDRYIEIGKTIQEKTGKYLCTINPNDANFTNILLQSAGSWYIDEDNKSMFVNNKAMEESMRIWKLIADSGVAKPVVGWNEFVGSFNSGEAATVVSGIWHIPGIREAEDQAGKWGVAPTPRLNIEGAANASNWGGSCWLALQDAPNSDVAMDFLCNTLGSNIDFYNAFLSDCGGVGSYLPASTTDAYMEASDFFGGQKIYQDFSEWSGNIPEMVIGTYNQEAMDALKNEIPNIINGADIKESLKKVEALYNQQVQ